LDISWNNTPGAGSYALYAELHDWNGETIKSNEVKITIN
jgi:hypothetical protein